jgi:hypothetical protein
MKAVIDRGYVIVDGILRYEKNDAQPPVIHENESDEEKVEYIDLTGGHGLSERLNV